jgi:hypothetical protein
MLGTLTPFGGRSAQTSFRSQQKVRQIRVTGTEIVLRNTASAYLIDLSDQTDGSFAYTLDTSQITPGNHEVASFEIALVMPAAGSPAVSFPFVDQWLDFAGLWRTLPGRTYYISVFRLGGKWIGSLNGSAVQRTKRGILGLLRRVNPALAPGTVLLTDDCNAYAETVSADTEFTFDASGLENRKSVLCFDLLVKVEADAALTFPVSKWFDFGYPARPFKAGQTHALTFLSLDGGETWIGKHNTIINGDIYDHE